MVVLVNGWRCGSKPKRTAPLLLGLTHGRYMHALFMCTCKIKYINRIDFMIRIVVNNKKITSSNFQLLQNNNYMAKMRTLYII